MSESEQNGSPTDDKLSLLERLSPRWGKSDDWQEDLYKQGCYRALDIPMRPGINAPKVTINKGVGLKGLLAIAALTSGIGAGGFVLSHFLNQPEIETVEKIIDRVFDSDIDMEIIPPE